MKQLLASPSLQLVTYPASATAQSAEFASADCVNLPIGKMQTTETEDARHTATVLL